VFKHREVMHQLFHTAAGAGRELLARGVVHCSTPGVDGVTASGIEQGLVVPGVASPSRRPAQIY